MEKVKKSELREKYGLVYFKTKEPAAPFSKEEFMAFLDEYKFKQLFEEQSYLGLLLR